MNRNQMRSASWTAARRLHLVTYDIATEIQFHHIKIVWNRSEWMVVHRRTMNEACVCINAVHNGISSCSFEKYCLCLWLRPFQDNPYIINELLWARYKLQQGILMAKPQTASNTCLVLSKYGKGFVIILMTFMRCQRVRPIASAIIFVVSERPYRLRRTVHS